MECVLSLVDEGSELRALIASTGGQVLAEADVAGPVNPRFCGKDDLVRKLADAIHRLGPLPRDAAILSAFTAIPADPALLQESISQLVPLDREFIATSEFEPAALAGSLLTPQPVRAVVVRADVGSRGYAV